MTPYEQTPPSVGRIVHYVGHANCQAAIVTATSPSPTESFGVDLAIFANGGTIYQTDVMADFTELQAGTWHWPERVAT